jgi:hypothetical protein
MRERGAHGHRQEAAAAGEEDQVRPGHHRLNHSVVLGNGSVAVVEAGNGCREWLEQ